MILQGPALPTQLLAGLAAGPPSNCGYSYTEPAHSVSVVPHTLTSLHPTQWSMPGTSLV